MSEIDGGSGGRLVDRSGRPSSRRPGTPVTEEVLTHTDTVGSVGSRPPDLNGRVLQYQMAQP